MRIISQNGMDFPYDHIVVSIDDNKVICNMSNNMSRRFLLGKYKCFGTAYEVFCMIHDAFLDKLPGQSCVFEMPEEDYETESY